MHHHGGQGREQLHAEIPVRDGVDAVAAGAVKAQGGGGHPPVGGIGSAGQGAGPQGRLVHALHRVPDAGDVPGEHHAVGQELLGEEDGLGPLQVGVAGNDGVRVGLRLVGDDGDERPELRLDLAALLPEPEAKVQGHLVVAAAGGVELLAHIPQPLREDLLHEHVDVLRGGVKGELAALQVLQHAHEALRQLVPLRGAQDAALCQHGRVGQGAHDILAVHAAVKAEGGVEVIRRLIQLSRRPTGPHLRHNRFSVPKKFSRPPSHVPPSDNKIIFSGGVYVGKNTSREAKCRSLGSAEARHPSEVPSKKRLAAF